MLALTLSLIASAHVSNSYSAAYPTGGGGGETNFFSDGWTSNIDDPWGALVTEKLWDGTSNDGDATLHSHVKCGTRGCGGQDPQAQQSVHHHHDHPDGPGGPPQGPPQGPDAPDEDPFYEPGSSTSDHEDSGDDVKLGVYGYNDCAGIYAVGFHGFISPNINSPECPAVWPVEQSIVPIATTGRICVDNKGKCTVETSTNVGGDLFLPLHTELLHFWSSECHFRIDSHRGTATIFLTEQNDSPTFGPSGAKTQLFPSNKHVLYSASLSNQRFFISRHDEVVGAGIALLRRPFAKGETCRDVSNDAYSSAH